MLMLPMVAQGQDGASVYGNVVDENGKPVEGARVTVWKRAAPDTLGVGKVPGSVTTASNGAFTMKGLAPGEYRFCAQLPKSDFINPCRWRVKAPLVVVRTRAMLMDVRVQLEKGHRIPIRVQDPQGRLAAHLEKTRGAVMDIGVSGPGEPFQHAMEVSKQGNAYEYAVVVPFDVPVKVSVHSNFFDIGDERGQRVAKGQLDAPRVGLRNRAPEAVTVRILGSKGN